MLGELTHDQVRAVLNEQITGRIGCCTDNRVYVIPITYVFANNCIYAHSKEGRKIQMMRSNPHVCFQVDIIENMANWRSVIAWGVYEELNDTEQRAEALTMLNTRFMPLMTSETVTLHDRSLEPHVVMKMKQAIIFRITLSEMTGRFEKSDR